MKKVLVDLGEKSYNIYIEKDFKALEDLIEKSDKKALIITDTNVSPLYLREVKEILEDKFSFVSTFEFEAGEKSKNIDILQGMYRAAIKAGLDRKSCVVALGGGVTGDMAGLLAATFMRGIGFIQIPTTLLSMVDSSVGGKVGIDFLGVKNIIGAFKQPDLVYVNTGALRTLPEREFKAGMGEVIKYAAISDYSFLSFLTENQKKITSLSYDELSSLIEICLKIKADVVSKDEKENSYRMILNFGHTIGHGIESAKNFSLLHGECVSLGMVCAFEIAHERGYVTEEYKKKFLSSLSSYGLLMSVSDIDANEVLAYVKNDKKKTGDFINFILPTAEGEVRILKDVTNEEMENAINKIIGEQN